MNTFLFRLGCAGMLVFITASVTFAQDISSTEIFSSVQVDGDKTRFDPELYKKACFNLVSLQFGCGVGSAKIHYGNRFGDNWDIFAVTGARPDQTRGIDLGELQWSDQFKIPEIEPWPKLLPGESRHITVNTSGADGAHGKPGQNADGTYPSEVLRPVVREGFADKPVNQQVQTTVKTSNGLVPSAYNPYIQIKKDHIYAFHVVDDLNDFYILVRIDDLIRGTKASISYKKVSPGVIF